MPLFTVFHKVLLTVCEQTNQILLKNICIPVLDVNYCDEESGSYIHVTIMFEQTFDINVLKLIIWSVAPLAI